MENNLKNIINKYKAKKITLKNSAKIIENENTRLVIKKDNPNILDTYNYLLSRSFDYFPKIIFKDNDYNVYEYVEDVNEPSEQRILDIITLTSILHSKTTFYKEVDIDNYKYLYETINKKLEYLFNYYNDIITLIEKNIYMSPSNYIIARNINKIFETINYCKYEVDSWYELIKDKRKIRVVNIHNNLSLDHYIKNDKPYLISWNKNKIDMPIYDLLTLYKKYYLDFDFYELFNYYESRYPLTNEERKMLFILMSIPEKLVLDSSEYKNSIKCRKFFDYIYKTKDLINEYKSIKDKTINEN
ncbi:MAG: hypothetical protein MR550_01765 [Bacilli bacterium]|nr:hypothetical protein [Bacilli bacterium]